MEKTIHFPLNGLNNFVENHLPVYVRTYFISWIYTSIFMAVLHCFDYCSFVINFEIRKYEFSKFILYQDCFGYSGFLEISYEF